MKRNYFKILIIAGLIASYIIGVGQGCSKGGGGSSNSGDSSTVSQYISDGTVPDKITLSTIYGKQVLEHLVSCLGTENASPKALKMYEDKQGTISVTGAVDAVSAPMLIGEISIAGEVCQDLIDIETELEDIDRRVLLGINFSSNELPSEQVLKDSIRRISLSCWGKAEDDTERQILLDALNEAFAGENYAGTAQDATLFMCTSMLSSTNALTL